MSQGGSGKTLFNGASALIAAAAFIYAFLRAARLSFSFDESATYISYVSSGFLSAFSFGDANNHILYTLLARLCTALGGSSELILRLPSLFGFALYLYFSWAILNRFFRRTAALAGFLLLNLNPFILDFFSVGRGYGLALGFEMAALYFMLAFLDPEERARGGRKRQAAAALAAGLAAALANLAFLNVLAALWALIAFVDLAEGRTPAQPRPQEPAGRDGSRRSGRLWTAALALSVPFNLLSVAENVRSSAKLIDPVSVRLRGLGPEDLGRVIVCGDDIFGREIEFPFREGVWAPPKDIPLKRLKLGLTAAGLDRLSGAEIEIGGRSIRLTRGQLRKWRHHFREGLEYFLSGPPVQPKGSVFGDLNGVINWKGDGVFRRAFLAEAARLLLVLAFIVGTVFGLGRLAVVRRFFGDGGWPPLRDSVAWGALFLFYEITALRNAGALYFGGGTGFIKDTVGSLISGSFYGARYGAHQETAVLVLAAGTAALFLLLAAWGSLGGRRLAEHREALALLAVMAAVSLFVIAQRAIFGNPFLMGRTASFLLPLFILFFLFFLRDLGRLGGGWRPAAGLLLAAVVALSAAHWVRTANLTQTMTWAYDADTKRMITDVVSLHAETRPASSRWRLGVEWLYWPATEYYRRAGRLTWLDVSMLPTARRCDLFYLPGEPERIGARVVVKNYPLTGNVLAK